MKKNIEDLQRFGDKLRFLIDELADYLPDDKPSVAKRIITKAGFYINGICRLSEVIEDYEPKNEACRCDELDEILESIPKKLSLGDVLELKDLITNHFQNSRRGYK